MSLVVHRWEASPYGPSLEFLCHVSDMGTARRLAVHAKAQDMPTKHDRLPTSHPLSRLAAEHPGELLWRLLPENHINPSDSPHERVGGGSRVGEGCP